MANNWVEILGISGSGTLVINVGAGTYVNGEVPSGTINGSNPTFTLANTPTPNTESLYKNGARLQRGNSNDYTISGATITINAGVIPSGSDELLCDYWH